MRISRRALLSIVPAATLSAVAPPQRAWSQAPRDTTPTDAAADHATLIDNTVAVLAGTAGSNARPEVAAKLASIASTAGTRLTALDGAGPGELFRGLPLGSSDTNLTASFQYLYEIALATRAPGGAAPGGDPAVQRRVIDGLVRLHDDYYGDQSKGYYGNWFNWEIGISSHLTRTLVLLRDELAAYRPDLTATCVASMDAYLRNGKAGDVDLDSRFHTGANLADITTNRILQGAVLVDDARVTKAVADQLTVLATIDPYHLRHNVTDGFYADGSFIQHASVAYTGSYGKGLLTRMVQAVKILEGTGYAQGVDLVGTVRDWVVRGFAPLIFEGWMMEIVKGRGVSRTTTGYTDVAEVVEAVVDLSGYAAGADATALKSYVKYVRQTSRAALDPARFLSPVTVARYTDILADAKIPAKDLNPAERNVAFNAMDKTVHRRPGYAFALARSSPRISKYEYMNGENLLPWFQGDGAHYLYLSGQDQTQAFGVDYFTTVSPYRLAGVTAPVETRRTIPELYGGLWYDSPERGFTSSSESQNTYVYFPRGAGGLSGGACLGAYGAAGLVQADDVAYAAQQAGTLPDDFVAYRNARATKSWFMLDDEIVVLAAGVGDPAGRAVTTTLDSRVSRVSRVARASDALTLTGRLRDGTPWSGTGTAPLAWLRYADADQGTAVGYVFLNGRRPTVALETVSRSRRAVRLSNPDTMVTKQVFSVSVEQPAGAPPASMAYALVPNASERQLMAYARGPVSVLANTARVQAVRHKGLGLVAVNVFAPGDHHAGHLSIDGPASVILREGRDGTVSMAVADPTTERDTVSVVIRGRALRAGPADEGVRVDRVPGGTRIRVATRHAYGRSFTATLR
ncbi:polysaccharide lyase family 8 super-sandwich domain-containing protein [Streptomyces sp. ME19-01-6]|uniref:polysaccharide lyase family 8 super-sandwich domain-containing protein n=1 Tax=Streptomyces sp. ME19-01-6 TaxID=3028686 RepID=UPI0029AF4010|nr:polysaccharide lyase family 8 super-sandwich domain-containing protein [Streptomyces sp. ME19-01-6]MDX3228137.1 polysaccharide lyase family 8 super-sandwich domain-containing protein [Streptomyces sp. ME19-01-6]